MFRKITFSVSLLILIGVIWFFRAFSSDQQCIKSMIVSELVIKNDPYEGSIYSCHRFKRSRVELSPKWKERVQKLNDVLLSYRQVFEKIYTPSWSIHPVRIMVDSENPYRISYEKEGYIIGHKVIDRPWMLRRFIAEIFVQDRMKISSLKSNDVLRDILSDLLTSYTFGDLKFFDPHTNKLKNIWSPNMKTWVKDVSSIEGICKSIWQPYALEELCSSQQISEWSERKEQLKKISKYSLRPFVYKLSWEVYKNLNFKQRVAFLSWFWKDRVLKKDWVSYKNTYDSFELFLKDAVTLSMQVMGIELDVDESIFYVNMLDAFYMPDMVIASNEFDNSRREMLSRLTQEDGDLSIYWRVNDEIYILPNAYSLTLGDRDQIIPSRRVMEYCQEININMFAHTVSRDERLLSVDICNKNKLIDYMVYLRGGLETFVRAYPQLGYVSYHLPSLKLAQWQGLGDNSIITFKGFSMTNSIERLLGLENPVKSYNGYKLSGRLKAIESYRPTEKKHLYLDIKTNP